MSLSEKDRVNESEKDELELSKKVSSLFETKRNSLSLEEKGKLRNRLTTSIDEYRYSKRRWRWSVAVVLVAFALVITSVVILTNRTPQIVSYANQVNHSVKDTSIRLVLSKGQEIVIDKIETEIQYDPKGEKIEIGSKQQVEQKIEKEEITYNTVFVPYGRRAQLTLSDGTQVWLNSGSKLVYPANFSKRKREVFIDGEGVFEVVKDKERPFVVTSNQFDIEVLGTTFDVSAYSDDSHPMAVLEEGIIALTYQATLSLKKTKMELVPGDMASFDPDEKGFEIKKVNPEDYLSWRKGYYIFSSEGLGSIVKRLSRYYNINIQVANTKLLNMTFSGCLDLRENPEEVLNIIMRTTPFKIRKEDDKKLILF